MLPCIPSCAVAMSRRMQTSGYQLTSVVAGIGDPRPMPANAYLSYREARLAARVAATVTTVGPIAAWRDLGAFRTLAQLPTCDEVTSSLDPRLMRLLEHADPTVLVTLEAFLDLAGDVKATAESLHVHRGTLYYRLQKVRKLAGADLGTGPRDGLSAVVVVRGGRGRCSQAVMASCQDCR